MDSGQQQSPAQCYLSNTGIEKIGMSIMSIAISSVVMNYFVQGLKAAENAKNHNYILKD